MVLRGVGNDRAVFTFIYPFYRKRLAGFQFVQMAKLGRNDNFTL